MLIIFLSSAWIGGIFIGFKYQLPPALLLLALVPLVFMPFCGRRRRRLLTACLGIVIFVGAAVYSYSDLHTVDESRLRFYNDGPIVGMKGMVAGDPDVRSTNNRLTVDVSATRQDDTWQDVRGRALVYVPRYPAYEYGDILLLTGEPETPSSSGDFDYRGYLAHRGINTVIYYPRIEVIETGRGFPPMAWIYGLRNRLAGILAEILPEPQASLAQGIILGLRGNIPDEVSADFSRSGTAHILAISGLHLSIMAGILLSVGLRLFGRRHYLYVWLALGAIWIYTLLTGMSSPVLRGAVMVSLFLFAEMLGRQRSAVVGLMLAAAIMVGIHPYILGDASFQLSFLAMAGLIFVSPRIRNAGRQYTVKWFGEEGLVAGAAVFTVDALSATLGALVAVWPVIAWYFDLVSLVGPLATLLVLPVLPGIIIFGLVAAVAGLLLPAAGLVVGWLAWPFISYLLFMVRWLAAPAVSSLQIQFPAPLLWVYYPVLAGLVWFFSRRRIPETVSGVPGYMPADINLVPGFFKKPGLTIMPLLVGVVLVSYTAFTLPDSYLRVSFLNVGEGDAILIQKGNRQVLVDGGPDPRAIGLELGRRMPFWDRTLDLLVLTHPHEDHLSGLVEVLRRYNVKEVLYPDIACSSPLYEEWEKLIAEKKIGVNKAVAGQRFTCAGVNIDVLSPSPVPVTGTDSDIDNNGVVLRVSRGQVSFLLAADIMEETERELLRERADLNADVLKVGHHGSDTSTTEAFLSVVTPEFAVISCGAGNRFGHPDDEVMARLEDRLGGNNVYRTDVHGTIIFTTDGERLWLDLGY